MRTSYFHGPLGARPALRRPRLGRPLGRAQQRRRRRLPVKVVTDYNFSDLGNQSIFQIKITIAFEMIGNFDFQITFWDL